MWKTCITHALIVVSSFFLICASAKADVVVVANQSAPIQSISRQSVINLFLGKAVSRSLSQFTAVNNNDDQSAFYYEILGWSPITYARYKAKNAFRLNSGNNVLNAESRQDLINALITHSSYIGYLNVSATGGVPKGLKILNALGAKITMNAPTTQSVQGNGVNHIINASKVAKTSIDNNDASADTTGKVCMLKDDKLVCV